MGCIGSKHAGNSPIAGLNAGPAMETDTAAERTFTLRSDGSGDGYKHISRPKSTQYRIIIDMHVNSCFGTPDILREEVLSHLPEALEGRFTLSEWTLWMTTFRDRMKPTMDCQAKRILINATVICIPYLFHRWNKRSRIALQFFEEMNSMCLEPKGMYMKPQHGRIQIDRTEYIIPWISLALDELEIEQLKKEPYFLWLRNGVYSTDDHKADETNIKCCGVLPAIP